jgi:hypothetical protein
MLTNAHTAMQAMPILWRTMMVVASFRAGDHRKTDHQHLFLGQHMDRDGIASVGGDLKGAGALLPKVQMHFSCCQSNLRVWVS